MLKVKLSDTIYFKCPNVDSRLISSFIQTVNKENLITALNYLGEEYTLKEFDIYVRLKK